MIVARSNSSGVLVPAHGGQLRGHRSAIPLEVRKEIARRTDWRCSYCGCELNNRSLVIDHVYPVHRGGTNSIDNLTAACRSCNHYKNTFTVDQFRYHIGKWVARLERDSVQFRNALRFGLIKIDHYPGESVEFYAEKIGVWKRP